MGRDIGTVAGEQVKDVILELGGNNPQVILDDADLDQAVNSSVFGSFFHSGQICMAITRIIVDEQLIDEFSDKFVEAAQRVKTGDPNKEDTIIGPLITGEEVDRVQEAVQKAKNQGAEVLLEGKREGDVISPTVIRGTNDTYTATEEMFGPVITIIPAKDEDHAVELANAVDEGLTSGVHSKDLRRAQRVAESLKVGMAHVNDQSVNDEPYIAFGGRKSFWYWPFWSRTFIRCLYRMAMGICPRRIKTIPNRLI